ncbi:MAG: hypothetical protein ABIH08_07085 [Candidatus Omnitrophota bacterium]
MKEILRYRNLILGLIIILTFGILLRSIFSHYSLEKEKLKLKQKIAQESKNTAKSWENLKQKYEGLKFNFLRGDTLAFKKIVEEKAQSAGIDIASLSISRLDKEYYWEAEMELEIVCFYKDFQEFIASLEEKNIEIERLKITNCDRNVRVNASLKGVIIK